MEQVILQLRQLQSAMGNLINKCETAQDELADETSEDEYKTIIKDRVKSKLDQLAGAVSAIKELVR